MEKQTIAITCNTTQSLPLDVLAAFQGQLKTLSKSAAMKLQKSILKYGFAAPIFVWQNDGHNYILDGHQRMAVLTDMRKQGYQIPSLPVVYIDAADEKEAREKLLHITGMYGSFSRDGYREFTADLEISSLLQTLRLPAHFSLQPADISKPVRLSLQDEFRIHPDIQNILNREDVFIFSFSGGRDSTLTAYLMRPYIQDKKMILLHVDTGAEFPDLMPYIVRIAQTLDAELRVLHPTMHILMHYCYKRRWPQPLVKDCIHKFINEPLDKELSAAGHTVLFRGGRATQATWKTMERVTGPIQQKDNRTLVNPIYDLDDDAVTRYLKDLDKDIGLWPGYAKGFARTACWFCPFQKKEQYRALRQYYPLLYDQLVDFRNTWEASTEDLCVLRYITLGGQVRG